MATHILNFPNADIHTTKIKSSSGEFTSDGNLSLLTSGGGTTNLTATTGGNIGIGTLTPSFKLDVNGDLNFVGTLYQGGVAYAGSPWTTTGSDIYYTTGNIGIGTASPRALLDVSGPTNIPAILTSGASGTEGDIAVLDGEAMQIGHWNSGTSTFTNRIHVSGGGNVGIGTASPSAPLHVAGGTIINSDGVAKKTYSYSGDLTSGQTIANSTIKLTFTNHTFSAKVVAHLVESDNEVSTLSFECCGGNWAGNAPSQTIALGPVTVFGPTSTNPWSSTVTRSTTTVSFKPTTNMAVAGHYNVFIEYISQSSSGVVSKITEGTTDVVTFGY